MSKKNSLFFCTCICVIALVISYPLIHDYKLYVNQWKVLATGKNLPNYDNAYGVLHYLFTPFAKIYIQLPNLICVGIYMFASYKLYDLILKQTGIKLARIALLVLLLNPLFWIFGVIYGSNDLFVAATSFLAILYYYSKKTNKSAIYLFLGITYKFSPLFILPFLGIDTRKMNFKYFIIIGFSIIILYTFGYILWGNSIFNPFIFGSVRGSKLLSVFAFINSSYAPLSFINIYNLDFLSIYCMILSWFVLYGLYIYYKLDKLIMIFVSFSSILLFYKVGHHQFYFTLLFITFYIFSFHYTSIKQNKPILISTMLFWSWLFLMTLIYLLTDEYKGQYNYIRELVGGPTFILHATMNLLYLRLAFKIKNNTPICN
jgi:hypothetical protein